MENHITHYSEAREMAKPPTISAEDPTPEPVTPLPDADRSAVWESAIPFGAVSAGVAAVFASPLGFPAMLGIMVGVFAVTTLTTRALGQV